MFLRIGHRGARAYRPENTLSSFAYAVELGANAVEFDIRRTMDGEIVVIHDETVDRVSDGEGLVRELTLEEIKRLRVDGEQIPTLREALEFLDGRVDRILVELKETGYEGKVLRVVEECGLKDRVILLSFHEQALMSIRALDSKVETGLIYIRHARPIRAALSLKTDYLVAFYKFIHRWDVERAHENSLKTIVWTINDPVEAERYAKMGVDGIASDRPDILAGIQPVLHMRS